MMKYKYFLPALAFALGIGHAAAADIRYGVMCYHDIVDETAPNAAATGEEGMSEEFKRQYYPQTVTVQRLISHFNWFKQHGYTPVSWKQIKDARAGRGKLPEKPVLLTFDDGYASFYKTIYPVLKAYNYPAVFALVTGWMETPMDATVAYGKKRLSRKAFITWEQVREMQKSGLVEIASHTHDLHRSNKGNPFGSEFAAALPGKYENGRYETHAEYRQRIAGDLKRSADVIEKRTGIRPDVLVWPYGQYNQTATEIARSLGFADDFTLYDMKLNGEKNSHVGRILVDQETGFGVIKSYLEEKMFEKQLKRAVYVNLDELYSPDAAQFNRNFDKLVSRVAQLGVNTVYLQAFSDDDGNGIAESVYFPNRHIKLKSDLFSRVAWQLMTRSEVKVYAWMPMTALNVGAGYRYADKRVVHTDAKSSRAVAEVYEDLAFSSRFNGILFQDDTIFADFKGNLPAAAYNNPSFWQQAQARSDGLISYSDQLKANVMKYSYNGYTELKTARNLDAGAVLHATPRPWFMQNLAKYTANYDYTVLAVRPYDDPGIADPKAAAEWVEKVAQSVKQTGAPLQKTIFDLQAKDWRNNRMVPARDLVAWMRSLKKEGVKNIAYSPDSFTQNQPVLGIVKPAFSIKP